MRLVCPVVPDDEDPPRSVWDQLQAELEAVFADDPFVKTGVARYEYIAFEPNPQPRRSSELDAFLRR